MWGCKAFVLNDGPQRPKLQSKAEEYRFVGYDYNSQCYRFLKEGSKMLKRSRNAIFNESDFRFDQVERREKEVTILPDPSEIAINDSDMILNLENEVNTLSIEERIAEEALQDMAEERIIELPEHEEGIDQIEPRRSQRLQSAEPISYRGMNVREWALNVSDLVEPTYQEAIKGKDAEQWEKAIREEYESLMKCGTWVKAKLPEVRTAIKSKWVLKRKRDSKGEISRFKARLVARGFSQKEGIDYKETFAPVVRINSLRLLLGLASSQKMIVHQLDVKTAYLNAILEEEVYMELPEGFGEKGTIVKLKRAIYGLKQAGNTWYKTFREFLEVNNFKKLKSDSGVFCRRKGKEFEIIAVYVDDCVVIGKNVEIVEKLKKMLSDGFKMVDSGEINWILGIEVIKTKKGYGLSQQNYCKELIKRFDMGKMKTKRTPVTVEKVSRMFNCAGKEIDKPYINAVGGLLYLAICTRPDLAFVVGLLGRFNSCPKEEHWETICHVFKYLIGNTNRILLIESKDLNLECYVDADWAGDKLDRKSTSGFLLKVGGAVFSWKSKKQTSQALSTMEAEYIALNEGLKELVWARQFLMEIKNEEIKCKVWEDNQSCISLVKGESKFSKAKHIDLLYHWNQEVFEKGIVEIDYCPSKCQLADALTKAIGPEKFEETLDAWRLVLSSSGSVEIDDDMKRNFIDVM